MYKYLDNEYYYLKYLTIKTNIFILRKLLVHFECFLIILLYFMLFIII